MRDQFRSMVITTPVEGDPTSADLRTRHYDAVKIIVREGSSELEVRVYPKTLPVRVAVSDCLAHTVEAALPEFVI